MKNIVILLSCFILSANTLLAQTLKPGFDKDEYRELMLISARSTASPNYFNQFPEPQYYKMIYQSATMGLDNLWDLWTNDQGNAVISLRGTTVNAESWLANFYAAMVPATGTLQINDSTTFNYKLADNPQAAVHVGWLLSTAYLSSDILPQIKSLYANNTRNILIMGHSQGGAIAFLLTAYFYQLQKSGLLPGDIRFKTYCSAGPKPGNLFFAYDYEVMTQGGWAYNVVNAADWVPETPISIQTLDDFNKTNPFLNAKLMINKQKVGQRLVLKTVYKKLDKPTREAQKNYQKYLGDIAAKFIEKNINGYQTPQYYSSNNYVRTGNTIVLMPDSAYYKIYPDNPDSVFIHHVHKPYLYLLDKLKL